MMHDASSGEISAGLISQRYQLGELLGTGGSASVFEAFDTESGETVALKILHPHLSGSATSREAFFVEARAAARLRHPNIAGVLAVGVHDTSGHPQAWIAMQRARGTSLAEHVEGSGPLTARQTLALGEGVLAALEAAHAAGVVHRDISPANVMVAFAPAGAGSAGGGRASEAQLVSVQVVDFGLADAAGRPALGSDILRSESGTDAVQGVLGSANYMSPEQAQGHAVDERGDLYQVGAVLYFALTARPPFVRDSTAAVMRAHVTAPPPVVSVVRPGIDRGFDRMIARALLKDPAARPASAAAMRQQVVALTAALDRGRRPATGLVDRTALLGRDGTAAGTALLAQAGAGATAERLAQSGAAATTERLAQSGAAAATERFTQGGAAATTERFPQSGAAATTERLAQSGGAATTERFPQSGAAATTERLARPDARARPNAYRAAPPGHTPGSGAALVAGAGADLATVGPQSYSSTLPASTTSAPTRAPRRSGAAIWIAAIVTTLAIGVVWAVGSNAATSPSIAASSTPPTATAPTTSAAPTAPPTANPVSSTPATIAPPAPTTVSVPRLATVSLADARSAAQALGLTIGSITPIDSPLAADTVLASDPVAGTSVAPGTAVNLTVASGSNAVPPLTGLTRQSAIDAITAAGFVPVIVLTPSTTQPVGTVMSSDPPASTSQRLGTAVTVVVAQLPQGVPAPTSTGTPQPTPTPTATPGGR